MPILKIFFKKLKCYKNIKQLISDGNYFRITKMTTGAKNIVIPGTSEINLSPIGFFRYAKEFYSASESYKPGDGFSPVRYYLYCHSLELLFKAYLLTHGVTKDLLKSKKYGHNLSTVLSESKKLGIGNILKISKEEEQNVELANDYYNKKGFEYFYVVPAVTGYKDLPELYSERVKI